MAVITLRLDKPPTQNIHPLKGFGAQFNTNLFTTDGQDPEITAAQLQKLRTRIAELKPGHSRIFIRKTVRAPSAAGKPEHPEFRALMRTIELAQQTGANVNLTWWQGPYASEKGLAQIKWPRTAKGDAKWPKELKDGPGALTAPRILMERFADVIERAHAAGNTCVTHVTIQNEVNEARVDIAKQKRPALSMRLYELLYRHLDRALEARRDPKNSARTLRECVDLVGGDLVEQGNSHQNAWLRYMARNMADVLDGYSIHVYWDPTREFPSKPLRRLRELDVTVKALGIKKPIYVTEYGVKMPGARPDPGMVGQEPVERRVDTALQHAWFNAVAPQYGCVGFAKWVLYRTDKQAEFGQWGMIDAPGAGFTRFPTYFVTLLFSRLTDPDWKAAGLGIGTAGKLAASKFRGPDGSESVVVVNPLPQSRQVRVQGLGAKSYFAGVWNRDGKGELHGLDRVDARTGSATLDVPRSGLVALSTRLFLPKA
jgi:hypothetical protein